MNKVQTITGLMLVFITPESVAENLQNMTSKTSRMIAGLSISNNLKLFDKRNIMRETEGDNRLFFKSEPSVSQYGNDQYRLKKDKNEVVNQGMNLIMRLKGNSRNVYAQKNLKYTKLRDTEEEGREAGIFSEQKHQRSFLKTNLSVDGSVLSAQKFKLGCEGSTSNKWRIKMNMKTKRMWVNLTNASTFSVPITYSQWGNDNKKRLSIIAGKGKKYIKATIDRSHSCRLGFSKKRYTYSITAKVARTNHLSGCCSDISR